MKKKRWSALALGLAALLFWCGCVRDIEPDLSGPWVSFELSRTDSDYLYSFRFKVICENDRCIVTGECADEEGNRYLSEEGIVLSDSTVEMLREFNLEALNERKGKKLGSRFVADAPTNKLVLTDAEGNRQEKSVGNDLSMSVYREMLPYFTENSE